MRCARRTAGSGKKQSLLTIVSRRTELLISDEVLTTSSLSSALSAEIVVIFDIVGRASPSYELFARFRPSCKTDRIS